MYVRTPVPLASPAGATVPEEGTPVYSLFAYPAMSNFSGTKYPLEWINDIHSGSICINGRSIQSVCKGEWLVVLDAAAYVGTNHLDLGQHRADFVTLSFYKMFGYPTGLGALLVRRDRASLLQERYFGGGAVNAYSSSSLFHAPRQRLHDRCVCAHAHARARVCVCAHALYSICVSVCAFMLCTFTCMMYCRDQ